MNDPGLRSRLRSGFSCPYGNRLAVNGIFDVLTGENPVEHFIQGGIRNLDCDNAVYVHLIRPDTDGITVLPLEILHCPADCDLVQRHVDLLGKDRQRHQGHDDRQDNPPECCQ